MSSKEERSVPLNPPNRAGSVRPLIPPPGSENAINPTNRVRSPRSLIPPPGFGGASNPTNRVRNVRPPILPASLREATMSPHGHVHLVSSTIMIHPVKEPVAKFLFRGYLRFHGMEVLDVKKCSDGSLEVTKALENSNSLLEMDKNYMYFLDVRSNILEKITLYGAEYAKIINSRDEMLRRTAWKEHFLDELDELTAYELVLAAHYYDIMELKELAEQKVVPGGQFSWHSLGLYIARVEAHRSRNQVLLEMGLIPKAPSYLARRLLSEVLQSHREQVRTLEAVLRSKKRGLPYILGPEGAIVGVHKVADRGISEEAGESSEQPDPRRFSDIEQISPASEGVQSHLKRGSAEQTDDSHSEEDISIAVQRVVVTKKVPSEAPEDELT